jgi:folate-binding protein YgfZ
MTSAPVAIARTRRDVVTVSGPDAASYLQGQLSQDVTALEIGGARPTFVLSPQGKVDGWGRIRRLGDDEFAIDGDPGTGARWESRLRRFLLRTKATIAVKHDVATLEVRGMVAGAGSAPLAPHVVGSDLIGWADAEPPEGVPAEAVAWSEAQADAARIRAGVPRWGAELDEHTIPATLGQWVIDASVSFTKGCYTGQELVARIDSRGGHVPRRLVGVLVGRAGASVGDQVEVGGEPVAPLTSVASDGDGAVGLAFVPRSIELGPDGLDAAVCGASAQLVALPVPVVTRPAG